MIHSTEQHPTHSVAVVGAGPAGRWIAALLVQRGVDVAIVDPAPSEKWPNTYGVWLDGLDPIPPSAPAVPMGHRWPQATVFSGREFTLPRAYGRIDNDAFQGDLDRLLNEADTVWLKGRADYVEHHRDGSRIHLDGGRIIGTGLVIDAAGGRSGLLTYGGSTAPGFQRAYGITAHFDGDPLQGREMVLMDFRALSDSGKNRAKSTDEPPSFMYGMHLGGDEYFVEETVLVAREATDLGLLRRRLYRRLERLGATPGPAHHIERCHIPMGADLPLMDQRVVPFGAAAGFVHPATGYQMARMLRAGPALADVIADGIGDGRTPDHLARQAWESIWPDHLRRARRLLTFGRDILMAFDDREIRQFFDAFFELEVRDWRAYLRGDAHYRQISKVMLRLFRRADMGLRFSLARRALVDGDRVIRAFRPRQGTSQDSENANYRGTP